MNRRGLALSLILPVAGFLSVGGAFPQSESQTHRRYINLGEKPVQAPFSDGVLVGDTLYLAGRIGIDPKTGKPPEKLEDEVKLMLDGFKATLGQAGMSMDDIVYVQVFASDLNNFDRFNAVYRTYYSKDFPARAFIGAGSLLRGGRFEMQAIASKK